MVFAYFSTGDDAQAANQVKMAQILEFTHSIRTPFAIAADFNMEPDQLWETGWVQSLGQRASIVVPEVGHTCTTGRGRIIDFAVISDSVRPFWRGITPEYNSPCKPHIGICLQFTATPTQVRVRQACFPKNFAFPKTVEQVVPSRKRMKSKTKPEEPIKKEIKFVCKAEHWGSALPSRRKTRSGPPNAVSQSIGFLSTRTQACVLGHCFQEFMQKAEECVAEAHGLAEHERIRYGGRSAGVKFRLRTVVPARRQLATRQCHNKHANCWELITARITDLIKLCQREQVGENVSAQWFQDIRSALKREVQFGLDEAMANSTADDDWTAEQWRQILMDPQQFDLDDLEEVRVNAMQRAKACAKKALALGRAAAKEWAAAAMSQGAKLAHRWTGRIGTKPQLAEEVITGSSHFCTPVDMMASRFKTWVAKWQKARDTTQDTVMAIQEVRQCAKANQDLPKIMLEDLDEALATMNEATGLGADRFGPRFIKSLPKEGRQKFVDLLNQCEEQVAWPWQVYITLVCLLAKEVKGERPISLLTMLYRIWSRTRKAFATEWCDAKAGFWDDAVRGSSPLQAALRRLVADELTQHTDNQEACTVLFDVESFYDSISLSLVARAGLKLAYPPVLLSLALLTYAGVRFLTAGCSGFSEGIVISNGVAAGCAQGNHAARLALYDMLQKSHELHPSTTTAQWVDDLAQRTQAPPSEVVNKAVEAALQLVQDLQESKLAVASKSVVIATTPQIAKQVVSSLARHDIHIQEAGQARDLGLDVSSARKSARRTMAKRWAKAGKRTKRCARFGRWASKQATARLWRTGAWAQKAYGTAAMGAPPSWVKQARTRAAEAAQCGGRGRCLTTAIALLHPNADPAVQVPCNLIRQWLIFWEHNHRLRPYIGKVWAKIATMMMARSPATRWRYVRGHMSAVIVTLMQHNWVPIRHTSWKDPEGNRWTLKAGGVGIDDWGFWQAFRASIEGQLWEKAARHELGAGLDGGADLTTLFKHDKFLERKGLHAARGMLLAAATASCWTQERRYRAGLVDTALCPRCEEADEDMFHRVWQCRANTGEIFDKTQHLVQKATQAKDTFECFWLRGVVPRSWTLQDTKLGFWRQFGKWRADRSLYLHLWRRLGNAQRSADQARGVVRGNYSGYVKLSWANLEHMETPQ